MTKRKRTHDTAASRNGTNMGNAPDAGRPVFLSSRPPGPADATLADCVRAAVQCAHPDECHSRAVLLDHDETRLNVTWCGACGAIAIASGDSAAWVRPGVVAALQLDAIARWTSEVELLGRAVGEVARAARRLGGDVAASAQQLEHATVELERAGQSALEAFET